MQVVPWVHPKEAALSQNPEWHLLFNTVDLGKMSYSHWVQKLTQEGSEQPFPAWPNTSVSKKVRMATWLSYSLDSSLSSSCTAMFPSHRTKLYWKELENLPPWYPFPILVWHGSVEGSGTKDYLLSLSSKSPAHIPIFLQFHTVFWPDHVTEWYLTPGVSALWEKDSDDVAWAPQVSAWSNKPQDLKGHLHNIPVLGFVLSISKSMVFPYPWQFSI